jgi:hypothetical protein
MDESVGDVLGVSVNRNATTDQQHDGINEIDTVEAQQENIETETNVKLVIWRLPAKCIRFW